MMEKNFYIYLSTGLATVLVSVLGTAALFFVKAITKLNTEVSKLAVAMERFVTHDTCKEDMCSYKKQIDNNNKEVADLRTQLEIIKTEVNMYHKES